MPMRASESKSSLAPFETPAVVYWGTIALAVYLSAFVIVTVVGFAFGYPDALWVWIVPFFAGFKWIFEVVAKYGPSPDGPESET